MVTAGSSITPSIRLVREIGAGGMGSIWVADHLTLQTQVVVKFMHARLAQDQASIARFTREAAAAANVKSPHVVHVLDHGVTPEGSAFIVMELLEGADLCTYLEQHGALPLAQVALIVLQTCKALARAHERGIVHRDIKPQNIFLSHIGEGETFVKVLDFGIAKSPTAEHGLDSATKTGALMGTPYYMSPEQIVGAKGMDHRTDLWALGVVAFEALTGRRPFEAETIGGLALAICNHPIPVPSQLNRTLPPEVDAWFTKACARDPSQRFSTAKEMANALQVAAASVERSSLGHARTMPLHAGSDPGPLARTPAPGLHVTTNAPMSGDDVPGVPKRGSALQIAIAVLVLVGGLTAFAVGIYMRHRPDAPPTGMVQPADPAHTAAAATLAPALSDLPIPSASATATASVIPSVTATTPAPHVKRPADAAAPIVTASTKPAPSAKSDRFSID